ncbi:MAG: hypothetical protein KA369_06505 [Spirochaetes bacterium]|nr:hypothetical protein [Spirochaetota bacterium]
METLITEYPAVTFVFMTGHPNGDGESVGTTSAYHCHTLITEHCQINNRYCIDYWSIETHDMNDNYYATANDDGIAGSVSFYYDWMTSHDEGTDYYGCSCAHTTNQRITCNRIAYAAWWIWARVAGWSGS